MNVPNVVEQALYFLERQFGVPCNVVQNKFLLHVLPLDDVNAHHRCLTIAGRQISRSLSFFFHITDWIFCTSNHWIFFTVKKHTSQKWNGRWQKQILGLPLSSNTLGAICHVGYVNK